MKILDSLFKGVQPASTAATAVAGAAKGAVPEATAAETESGKIISDLESQGYVISSEEADRISQFIDSSDGTSAEKMQVVKTALDKKLPISVRSLESVKAALFSPTISAEVMRMLEADSAISTERADVLRLLTALAGEEAPMTDVSGLEASAVSEGDITLPPSEIMDRLVRSILDEVRTEAPDLKSLLTTLMNQLENTSAALADAAVNGGIGFVQGNEHMPLTAFTVAETIAENQVMAKDVPKEAPPAADTPTALSVSERNTIAQPEKTASETDVESRSDDDIEKAFERIEAGLRMEASDPAGAVAAAAQGISMLIKEITPKMASVKAEFEGVRKAIRLDLQRAADELIKSGAPSLKAEERISQAIERIDKTIMKSDIPLYTSMQAEKQLLKMSSSLQDAKGFLKSGDVAKAGDILRTVEKELAAIEFQPSKVKAVRQLVTDKVYSGDYGEKALKFRASQQLERIFQLPATPRGVLETMKSLGLDHDSEVMSTLSKDSGKGKNDWTPKENLKEILMRLAQDTEEKLTTVTAAEKTLSGLTGQQLLSRPEARPQGQTLFFSIPMELAQKVEDLKIYVQSKKNGGKVDWENCTFYFAVHTQRFGDIGINFTAARKSVAIQVKCDDQRIREAIAPVVDEFKNAMGEAGYRIAGISYSRLGDAKTAAQQENSPAVVTDDNGKGMNIRI